MENVQKETASQETIDRSKIKSLSHDILEDCSRRNIHEWGVIKNLIKDDIAKLIVRQTGRSPMILPILMEV